MRKELARMAAVRRESIKRQRKTDPEQRRHQAVLLDQAPPAPSNCCVGPMCRYQLGSMRFARSCLPPGSRLMVRTVIDVLEVEVSRPELLVATLDPILTLQLTSTDFLWSLPLVSSHGVRIGLSSGSVLLPRMNQAVSTGFEGHISGSGRTQFGGKQGFLPFIASTQGSQGQNTVYTHKQGAIPLDSPFGTILYACLAMLPPHTKCFLLGSKCFLSTLTFAVEGYTPRGGGGCCCKPKRRPDHVVAFSSLV